jgi:hypothetical protein
LGDTSREEVMEIFVEELGLKDKIKINVVSSEVVNRKFNFFANFSLPPIIIPIKIVIEMCMMQNIECEADFIQFTLNNII